MPLAAQYKMTGGKTAIDEILDLDEEDDAQSRQISSKFIRQHTPIRQDLGSNQSGGYAPGPQEGGPPDLYQQGMTQNMISSMHSSDPRYKQQYRQMSRPYQPSQHSDKMVEKYEEISIQGVANSIFKNVSSYIDALDDSENPLHAVSVGLLSSGIPTCDKTIYIIIIIILCIAIACLLYRMNRT